jgi:two-component system chemotaxis family response regulator WspR
MNVSLASSATYSKPADAIMVLLVDDQLMMGEAIRRALIGEIGIAMHYCADPAQALALAREVRPTVILQDLVMPGIDGLDLVRQYRADPVVGRIPIIVLSTKEESTIKRDAFKAGANDYLVKVPDKIELVARIRYHSAAYKTEVERDEAYRALRESQQRLVDANLELQRLNNVDGLTGLSNKRYFAEYIEAEWKRAMRSGAPLSMLMIDVDHFKLYNDTYGHLAGDDVLRKVADTLVKAFSRSTDLAARFGGEEFAAILPDTPATAVEPLADRIVKAVEALRIPHAASPTSVFVTISAGASTAAGERKDSYFSLVDAADRALYAAKQKGRNRAATISDA